MNVLVELTRDSLFSVVIHLSPRLANVLMFILVGRLAGPAEAGIFTLAVTYLIIFTTVMRGPDDLVIRQVSREPAQAPRYLTNFLLLRLGLSLLSYCVLLFVILVIFDYADDTATFIRILTLSLVPDGLTYVAQAILLGQRCFGPPAITMTFVSLFKLVGGGLVLANGGSLQYIAWVWSAGSFLGMVVLLAIVIRGIGRLHWTDWLDWRPLASNLRAIFPFLLITAMMALEFQVDTVFLSAFRSKAEVGWYGAATTVTFSLTIFSQAYRMSIYPLMARYALQSPAKLSKLYKRSMRYLGTFILPIVIGIALLSSQIVSLVFGPQFRPTAKVLPILIPTLIFMFLNVPNSRMMLVHNRQGWSSLFLVCSVTTNIMLNLMLAPSLGASGAAMARLCSSGIFFLLNYLYVARFLAQSDLPRLLSKPVLATLIMAVIVWSVRAWSLPLSIGVGVVTYAGTLWLVGGILPDDIAFLHQAIAGLCKCAAYNSKG